MNGIDVGDFRRADDGGNIQIAAGALGWSNTNGFIGEANMQAVTIGFRINGDSLDSKILTRADNADGDLATIGDQNFLEHISGDEWRTGLLRTPPRGRSPSAL